MDIEAAVESIWQHTLRRSYFPQEWRGRLTIEQAYRVQLAAPDRWLARGERLAGWKVGLTAPVIQKQFGMPEPVMGFLLESGHRDSGVAVPARRPHPARLRERAVPDRGTRLEGPNVTRAQARAAITAVQPAFEIIETRGDFRADVTQSLTDNCQQKAFVTGPASPLPARLGARRHDGRGASSTAGGSTTLSAARRRGTRSARWPGSPRSSPSSAGGSSPGTGSCRAPSRSSTRSGAGDRIETQFMPFGRGRRRSFELELGTHRSSLAQPNSCPSRARPDATVLGLADPLDKASLMPHS